jgi:hypothetical protein
MDRIDKIKEKQKAKGKVKIASTVAASLPSAFSFLLYPAYPVHPVNFFPSIAVLLL